MADTTTIEIEGFEELVQALESAPDQVMPLLKEAMTNSMLYLHGTLREYPQSTEANHPGGPGSRWYERGYGQRWQTKSGEIHGYRSSAQLGKRWTYKVGLYPQGIADAGIDGPAIEGIEGNNAAYASAVQGPKQAAFHRRRGWVTVEDALEAHRQDIYGEFDGAVEQWAAGFNRGE